MNLREFSVEHFADMCRRDPRGLDLLDAALQSVPKEKQVAYILDQAVENLCRKRVLAKRSSKCRKSEENGR